MKSSLLALVFCLGCYETPNGWPTRNHEEALAVVLQVYGQFTELPQVYIVPDQHCRGFPGFLDRNNRCAAGEYFVGRGIYLVETVDPFLYSRTSLAHEALHLIGRDHPILGNWAADSPEGQLIQRAKAALAELPEIDRVKY